MPRPTPLLRILPTLILVWLTGCTATHLQPGHFVVLIPFDTADVKWSYRLDLDAWVCKRMTAANGADCDQCRNISPEVQGIQIFKTSLAGEEMMASERVKPGLVAAICLPVDTRRAARR